MRALWTLAQDTGRRGSKLTEALDKNALRNVNDYCDRVGGRFRSDLGRDLNDIVTGQRMLTKWINEGRQGDTATVDSLARLMRDVTATLNETETRKTP